MCLISECVCCPVYKNCNYPTSSLMTAKEWLAVLSPPGSLIAADHSVYKTVNTTLGTLRCGGGLQSKHVPCCCFCIISASFSFDFFCFEPFLHEVALMFGVQYCTMLRQLLVGL